MKEQKNKKINKKTKTNSENKTKNICWKDYKLKIEQKY